MSKSTAPLERAARALSTLAGTPEEAWQDYLPAARAVIDKAKMEWRPIASAPLDGSPLLLFVPAEATLRRQMMVGGWDKANSRWTAIPTVYRINPTHWLPLPPPPQS